MDLSHVCRLCLCSEMNFLVDIHNTAEVNIVDVLNKHIDKVDISFFKRNSIKLA